MGHHTPRETAGDSLGLDLWELCPKDAWNSYLKDSGTEGEHLENGVESVSFDLGLKKYRAFQIQIVFSSPTSATAIPEMENFDAL